MSERDPENDTKDSTDRSPASGVPLTPRTRAKSALLWGAVGALSFLVVAQGYLLLGGTLPIRYVELYPIAIGIGATSGGITYLTEHRLRAKRRV